MISLLFPPFQRPPPPTSVDAFIISFMSIFFGLDIREPSSITAHLPLVRRPICVVVAISLYLLIVWGWRSHIIRAGIVPYAQDPTWFRRIVIAHNLFLCGLSSYLGVGILYEAFQRGYSLWGNANNAKDTQMGFYIFVFYISKLYEFMDTFLMLMRGNIKQIQILHVYHHASIAFVCWIICYLSPTGDIYLAAAVNAWVHAAMYLYYLLAITIARTDEQRRKYLWWGKHLAMVQMLQFTFFFLQSIYAVFRPAGYAPNLPKVLFFYSMSLLYLFSSFFFLKYGRPGPRTDEDPCGKEIHVFFHEIT